MKYFSRISGKLGHSTRMCFAVNGRSQDSHIGGSSPDNKYECVKRQWPILLESGNNREYGGNIFDVCDHNCWINRMKFIILARVPYMLPLIQAKPRDVRDKLTCCKFRIYNWQRESWFGGNVGPSHCLYSHELESSRRQLLFCHC